MFSALLTAAATFPVLVSLLVVSCLKSSWRWKGDANPDRIDDAYMKKSTESRSDQSNEKSKTVKKKTKKAKKTTEKKAKKGDGKEKKNKNLAKFFIFHKDDELKTATEDLSLDSTQNTSTSDSEEHESPISSYHFSDDGNLRNVKLLPAQPEGYAEKLKASARRGRRGKKSPQDYLCPEDEDSLFNIPSLAQEPMTLMSAKTMHPLDIQDSRILRHQQHLLGYKKSHCVFGNSPLSETRNSTESLSSGSFGSLDVTVKH